MSAAKTGEARMEVDEHLTKFPPLKGPRIGGNFHVDENVVAALPIPGSRIVSANTYGNSLWGRTAKIVCETPDGQMIAYFHKGVAVIVSKPYFWGRYKLEPDCCFLLAEFREVGWQPPEPVRFTARLAEMHRNSVSPTGKFGFHMQTMDGLIQQHDDGWSDSWQEIFSNLLGHLLEEDTRRNPLWPEMKCDGRNIKPCLVHTDLWDGNTTTDMETGEPFIFDGSSFYAHKEYETGNWRVPRHRLAVGLMFGSTKRIFQSLSQVIKHRQAITSRLMTLGRKGLGCEEFALLSYYNTSAAILYPAVKQRDAIYEGMTELCTRFCKDEMTALLNKAPEARMQRSDTWKSDDEEESEEPE